MSSDLQALTPKLMGFKPPPKRKKLDGAPSPSPTAFASMVPTLDKRDVVMELISKPRVHDTESSTASLRIQQTLQVNEGQICNVNLRIQQARNHAAAQVQQDGCTGHGFKFRSLQVHLPHMIRLM
ncbi:uncharacterized protein LOC127264990 isoform X2 [Andrographis paniculata]|uniref:uncharacterized protein LOC127264990 isoform X2 n=1 Tax=Andrographis paniculata TaxID=175694 RepID=UPI0021E7BA68|nr:uncharacterized protein LOC127264990 isoform X2 [Andrographis paniculata]